MVHFRNLIAVSYFVLFCRDKKRQIQNEISTITTMMKNRMLSTLFLSDNWCFYVFKCHLSTSGFLKRIFIRFLHVLWMLLSDSYLSDCNSNVLCQYFTFAYWETQCWITSWNTSYEMSYISFPYIFKGFHGNCQKDYDGFVNCFSFS